MYLKIGIYRATAPSGETQVVRVANFEMSKSSLLGRVTNPLPISDAPSTLRHRLGVLGLLGWRRKREAQAAA
jgi:hypothetical protein